MAAVGGCWAGGPPVPCCAAVGWPAVCRRASSADVAVPLAASLIAAVAGCSFDGAAVERVPADAPGLGPEPASLAASTLTTLSISVVQGPAVAELTPSANSATLARMNAFAFMGFPPWSLSDRSDLQPRELTRSNGVPLYPPNWCSPLRGPRQPGRACRERHNLVAIDCSGERRPTCF